jgi:hypothetical protein
MQTSRLTAVSMILGALLAPLALLAQNETNHGPTIGIPADGRGDYVRQLPPRAQAGTGGAVVQGNGISYHNGPVMRNGVNIYYIWYGDWSQDSTANAILTDYARYVGGSPYFNINTTYGDTSGNVPNTSTTIKYVSSVSDSGSLGTSLSDSSIWTLVTNALKTLPADPDGVYFVLTAPYVAETSGFLTKYCGWHTYNYFNNTPIKYSFVGNAAANMGACAAQSTGPNGDAEADAMVSVIAHELEEAATDPQLNAWYDATGAENADKCAWTFGGTYVANGAYANMTIGPRNYLIQQNWVNAGGGSCALSYTASTTPDFSLSVSPNSLTVTAGQAANYTVTAAPSNGWSGTVTYTVPTTMPAGAFASVNGNVITISTTAGTTPAGTYNFTISGTDGTLTHTASAALVVTVPPAPTFSIGISPSSQGVKRPATGSATATYTVTLTAASGYTGTVFLSTGGATTGVSLSLSTASIQNGSGTATLTATVTSSSKKGNHGLTVTGKDATTSKSVSASLQVN